MSVAVEQLSMFAAGEILLLPRIFGVASMNFQKSSHCPLFFAFAGYASLFNVRDAAGDIVMPGAFRRSLSQRSVSHVRMLFQHKPEEPVGVWDRIMETAQGLYVTGRLLLGSRRALDLAHLIDGRAVDGLSIGYRAVKATRGQDGVRLLRDIDLWEISLVTFPMLDGARIGIAGRQQDPAPLTT
jgi:hypothetical protein